MLALPVGALLARRGAVVLDPASGRLTGADTGGLFSFYEVTVPPPPGTPPERSVSAI